ncbi:MAG TPA: HAD-IIB family hydrolase [Candidatus Saccharimonadales bacterium]|nr:HAD-IIB family hydrolase [Candidatus Saccharimonadales bacterium]
MKKVIIFDLDETLTETRSPITDETAELVGELLKKHQVCVISGGQFSQFEKQLLANLKIDKKYLSSLHLMPTCGTRYFKYAANNGTWQLVYAENFTDEQKKTIIEAMEASIDEVGYRVSNPKGPLIEDRGSQVTYSALGQDAGPAEKKAWDSSGQKKLKIRNVIAPKIPQFEVRVGGTTSIDITKKGIDKAYGMKKLMKILGVTKKEMLFIGDRLGEGGNDYPVKAMGIDCVAVGGYEQTPSVIRDILTTIPQ